jgi:hypothetical protein
MEVSQAATFLRTQSDSSMPAIVVTLGQLCQHVDLHEGTSIDALLHKVAELKFEEKLHKAPQDFVGAEAGQATDSWPLVAFPGSPFGNPEAESSFIIRIRQSLRILLFLFGNSY